MAADDGPQQWRIKVHAKSRNFSLRIRATGTPPAASRPHDLTALLRLRGFILKVKSASAPTQPRRGGLLKSMFRRFFKRIRPPPTPTQKEAPAAGAALLSSLSRLKQLSTEVQICALCSIYSDLIRADIVCQLSFSLKLSLPTGAGWNLVRIPRGFRSRRSGCNCSQRSHQIQ